MVETITCQRHSTVLGFYQNELIGAMNLNCPICRVKVSGFDPMLEHLITEHDMSKRKARFLTQKLVEWRQGRQDPIPFRESGFGAKRH